MNKKSNLIWGILLLIIGMIVGLNTLEITNVNIFFKGWWTLFIILPSLIGILDEKGKIDNWIGLIVGIALLLACQNIIKFEIILKLLMPTILMVIGLSLILKEILQKKENNEDTNSIKENEREYYATFSSQTISFADENFEGCQLNAIFGTVICDMKEAIIKKDCIIAASSIFGNITINVPDNINIKVTSTSIFGGIKDQRKAKKTSSNITIYINTISMFGGIELK